MAQITLGGTPTTTVGNLPEKGTQAPDFTLTKSDLSTINLANYKGQNVVLNIFPSVDTGVCATSARTFNKEASALKNTKVVCISRDLPFAQARFCGAEGIENVEMLSDFKDGSFGNDYGVTITDGAFAGLHSRGVVVIDPTGTIIHTQQVTEIGNEPDYKAALASLSHE